MNKARVEAFTDAIVAIVMTIMVLEIKIPRGSGWLAVWSEKAYFLAYLISFFRIATTWYNHHYLFTTARWISKRVFWLNMIWLFFMSLFPVATGWISEQIHSRVAAYFYFLIFTVWAITYYVMVGILAKDNPKQAKLILQMLKPSRWIYELVSVVLGIILIYWQPISALVILAANIIYWIIASLQDSDKLVK